jgi:sterol desaturase/sphingolipid hydroxylase (fatty acid hydroxylase superfamily)
MDSLVAYFTTIPSSHRALILAGGIAFFWIWESAVPLFRFEYRKWSHAFVNLFFTATTIVVNFVLAFLLLQASDWAVARGIGVLGWLPALPLALQAIVGLLLLDLIGAWLAHYVEHKTTSANRHHPGESVIRFVFTLLAVVVVGAPMWLVFLYQSASVVLSQFNHANIALPPALDRALAWIIVSPDMHKVHHHYVLPYTDSNYGNVFSVWDRLFGTFMSMERAKLVYGIDTHMDPKEHSSVGALMTMPLRPGTKQRSAGH